MAEKKYKYYTKTITCPDGKRKYIRGKTKREMERKYAAALLEVGSGVNISSDITVSEFVQEWYDRYKKPVIQPQSAATLLSSINNHVIPYIGNKKVRDVRSADIASIINLHGLSSKGANARLLSTLRSIFDAAIDNDIIVKSPVPKMQKAGGKPTEEKVPLTDEEIKRLLSGIKGTDAEPVVKIALLTGMRRGEIAGLMWDCVDFSEGVIRVRRQRTSNGEISNTLKTKSARRDIPMSDSLRAVLMQLRQGTTGVMVLDVDRGAIDRIDDKCSAVLGRRITMHYFRHTFATKLVASGTNPKTVQHILGHSDIKMTMGLYAHYEADNKATASAIDGAVCIA